MKTFKRNCRKAFFASLLLAIAYQTGHNASKIYAQDGSTTILQPNWNQNSTDSNYYSGYSNPSSYSTYSPNYPLGEDNGSTDATPYQVAWQRMEDCTPSYPCPPMPCPPQDNCGYYSEASFNHYSEPPVNEQNRFEPYRPTAYYGQEDIPSFNDNYTAPGSFSPPSAQNRNEEYRSEGIPEDGFFYYDQIHPNSPGYLDSYQDSNLYHVPAELNAKPDAEVYYNPHPDEQRPFINQPEPAPQASRPYLNPPPPVIPPAPEFHNGQIGFKEAKSRTHVIKKPVDLKEKDTKTVVDAVGKTTFDTPSIGFVDPHSTDIAEEEDQVPSSSTSSTSSKPTDSQSEDPAIKAFPAPASKLAERKSTPSSNKQWISKALVAQNETQSPSLPPPSLEPAATPAENADETPPLPPESGTNTLMPPATGPEPLPQISPTRGPSPEPTAPNRTTTTTSRTTTYTPSTPSASAATTTNVPTSTDTTTQTQTIVPRPNQTVITPTTGPDITEEGTPVAGQPIKEISINFNNVAMVEFIRFISRISNKNFIFDEADLQFNVTIVSEEPTSIENLMAALLQELRIRDLMLIEQGNNILIHRNPRVRAPAHIVAEGITAGPSKENELVTQVFRLNTLDPVKAAEIIRPLLSDEALVEVLRDTNNVIITDIVANVNKIAQLINSLDAPNSGVIIGQYAVRNAFVDALANLADKILQPIAQGNPFVLVPHPATNSIFVVSNPFIVERALAILENLDLNEGRTKIFTLEKLRLSNAELNAAEAAGNLPPGIGIPTTPPGAITAPPPGIGVEGSPFGPGEIEPPLMPGGITAAPRWIQELPPGHIERTLFFIYKLKYRRGDQIELALRKIADSLLVTGTTNEDLIAGINSIQWLESSNSLIFTGTVLALDKVRELIEEIDVPLRQVFIEMLILSTTINDSLSYGVEWGARFGGGNTAGSEAFLNSPFSPLLPALDSASIPSPEFAPTPGPNPNGLARTTGFSLGVVGRHLTHDGLLFNSIGALVTAIHLDSKVNIIMNPKIITEDNNTAEIFVGNTDRFKTQSISNDFGTVITNNFQFLDVGTTLRVTPLIGNNDTITLEIVEEITSEAATANIVINNTNANDVNLIPILNKSRTLTRVHVPNGFFIVLSGMIQDTRTRGLNQLPCLGGIPILGGVNKSKTNVDDKRNLMIFIRPLIIDTEEDLENITKRQQDVYREKGKFRRSWNYEIDEALDFLSIKRTDPDERGCTIK